MNPLSPVRRNEIGSHDLLSPPTASVEWHSESPFNTGRRPSASVIPNRDYILDLANSSRPLTNASERTKDRRATFQCSLCPKQFTRAYHLRSHLRTHTDERPFVCMFCGKAFSRGYDRKRHEGLHSGEKKFVCGGHLKDNSRWGCGHRFARVDALGRHFRSEAGRVCIKPLLEEEEPIEATQLSYDTSMPIGGNRLPQELLQQYHTLGISWDTLPNDTPDEIENDMNGRSSFDANSASEYGDDGDYSDPHYGWASDVRPYQSSSISPQELPRFGEGNPAHFQDKERSTSREERATVVLQDKSDQTRSPAGNIDAASVQIISEGGNTMGASPSDISGSVSDNLPLDRDNGQQEEPEKLVSAQIDSHDFIEDEHIGLPPPTSVKDLQSGSTKLNIDEEGDTSIADHSDIESAFSGHWDRESVFSDGAGTQSSQTSLDSIRVMNVAENEFVSLLLADDELKAVCQMAVETKGIGHARFENNFRRLLNIYSSDLRREATVRNHHLAASFVRNRSRYMARNVCLVLVPHSRVYDTLVKETAVGLEQKLAMWAHSRPSDTQNRLNPDPSADESSDTDSVAEDENEDDEKEETHFKQLSLVKDFLKTSLAFGLLRQNLVDFVRPSFHQSLKNLVRKLTNPKASEPVNPLQYNLVNLVDRLQVIPLDRITTAYEDEYNFSNNLKGNIERWTHTQWEWWPLLPYKGSIHPKEGRICWTCVSVSLRASFSSFC
jgi:hypothetical protein